MTLQSRKTYFAAADFMRVFCIGLVAWFHLWQQSWLDPNFTIGHTYINIQSVMRRGYIGVDWMLLLSGFLLYYPCAQNHLQGKPLLSPIDFYHKRFFRIIPSYLLAILIAMLFTLRDGPANGSAPLWKDLLSHLTFTFTFSKPTYLWSNLNVALWTIAIEMQFYLLFPLLAKAFSKKPAITFLSMTVLALLCRSLIAQLEDVSLFVNQLPCMLDLYAFGMLAAHLTATSSDKTEIPSRKNWIYLLVSLFALVAFLWMLGQQHPSSGKSDTQHLQLYWRFPVGLAGFLFLWSGAHWSPKANHIVGNPILRFLSAISFNFYIWHQYLAVKLKAFHVPNYFSDLPQRDEGLLWQQKYFWLSLLLAILLATFLTYCIERPMKSLLSTRYAKTMTNKTNIREGL